MSRLNEIDKQLEEFNKQLKELVKEKTNIQEEERKEKVKIELEKKMKLESEKNSRWNEIELKSKELQELYKAYLKNYDLIKYEIYDNSNIILPSLINLFGI